MKKEYSLVLIWLFLVLPAAAQKPQLVTPNESRNPCSGSQRFPLGPSGREAPRRTGMRSNEGVAKHTIESIA